MCLLGESRGLGRTEKVSGKHTQARVAGERCKRWKEGEGKREPGAGCEKSQSFPPPPSEASHRAGRDTPQCRCVIHFLTGTGESGQPHCFQSREEYLW